MRLFKIEDRNFSWEIQYLISTKPTFHLLKSLIVGRKNLVYFSKLFFMFATLALLTKYIWKFSIWLEVLKWHPQKVFAIVNINYFYPTYGTETVLCLFSACFWAFYFKWMTQADSWQKMLIMKPLTFTVMLIKCQKVYWNEKISF